MRWYDRLLDGLGGIAGAIAVFLAGGVTLDVALRYFGLGAIHWILEVSEYGLLLLTFLGAPWALRKGAHVRIDIVVARLSRDRARIAGVTGDLIGLAVCLILLIYGSRITLTSWGNNSMIYKELVFPEWCLLAVIPVSALLMTFEFAQRIHRHARGGESGERPADGL